VEKEATPPLGGDPRYKYNGKKLDEEKSLNWLAYGARYYDPEIGRWMVVDPAGEFWSVYLYVANNPLRYTDFNGMFADDFLFNENYELIGYVDNDEPHRALVMDDNGDVVKTIAIHAIDDKELETILGRFLNQPVKAINMSFGEEVEDLIVEAVSPFSSIPGKFAFLGDRYSYAATEGFPTGRTSWLTGKRSTGKMDIAPEILSKNVMFHYANGKLYNNFDAGNYAWGAAMKRLGFSLFMSRTGAHLNNFGAKISELLFGSEPQYPTPWYHFLDSSDDQNAIINGYREN
jgi:RHS repeat-associated protein